jgi:hypothetical protein
MNGILLMIREAGTSKKFIVTIAGTITAAFLKIGLDIPVEDVAAILAPVIAYLFAQGWADRGKEAAKVQGTVAIATSEHVNLPTMEPAQAVKDKLL